jgi:hypothetical protein
MHNRSLTLRSLAFQAVAVPIALTFVVCVTSGPAMAAKQPAQAPQSQPAETPPQGTPSAARMPGESMPQP